MFRALLLGFVVLVTSRGIAAAHPPDLAPDAAAACIAALINDSTTLSLPLRVERSFTVTLRAADEALRRGEVASALTLLKTFVFDVRGVKRARRLPADAADALIARAEEAIAAVRAGEPGP
jgi:hypothetical protein